MSKINLDSISTNDLELVIERYIDQHSNPFTGVSNVLDTLVEVCNAKANHLRENWQDPTSAKPWDRCGDRVSTARRFVDEHFGNIYR